MKRLSINIRQIATLLFALTLYFVDFRININNTYYAINNFIYIILLGLIFIKFIGKSKIFMTKYDKIYIIYWAYAILVALVYDIFLSFSIPTDYIFHILYMVIMLTVFRKILFDEKVFWTTIYIISLINIVVLTFQEISRFKTGTFIKFVYQAQKGRAAGFYSEPAHLCMLLGFAMCCILFEIDCLDIKGKTRLFGAALMTIAMLASMSSSGLIYIIYLWFTWAVFKKRLNYKYVILIVVLIVAISYIYNNTEWISTSLEHLQDTDFSKITSGSFRIMRGFDLYSRLPFFTKIIGYGTGNTQSMILHIDFRSIYDNIFNYKSPYVSSLSSIFLETGILGGLFYVIYFIQILQRSNLSIIIISTLYFILILSNEIIYTPQIMVLLFILLYEKDKTRKKSYSYRL